MPPTVLLPLFASSMTLTAVGPKNEKLLQKLCGPSVLDICWHFPYKTEYRQFSELFSSKYREKLQTFHVIIRQHFPRAGRAYRVECECKGQILFLLFFNGNFSYLQKILPAGSERLVSGFLERHQGQWQMIHPELAFPNEKALWTGVLPIYSLTAGLYRKTFLKIRDAALARLPDLSEWTPPDLLQQKGWPSWKQAILSLHFPKSDADLDPCCSAYQRLAFDEIFAHQLILRLLQRNQHKVPGILLGKSSQYVNQLRSFLPFALTEGQERVLQEILQDTQKGHRMMRLLQGDVGSGKTVVAFMALLHGVESGYQGAFLAPTEVLAQQQYQIMKTWCEKLGISIGLFTSQLSKKNRSVTLEKLSQGEISIAVGTHSLLEPDIQFHKLGFVVIDEQQRFGVDQRSKLMAKGPYSHALVMTATPIPRTLALAFYGDIPLSSLKEKPAHRQPIITRAIPLKRLKEVYQSFHRIIQKGQQIYWVCPLIEESSEKPKGHIEKRYRDLQKIFGGQVGVLHGRMKPREKERIMEDFKKGILKILVSTTVIEVGIDVPQATVMVIENAESFGLFQLHQLRGRVGRGTEPSFCILLYQEKVEGLARQRINILCKSQDGFEIAEKDLDLRGSGDFLGTRQSGLPSFRFFRFENHKELLPSVNKWVDYILKEKLYIQPAYREALFHLLTLFNYEKASLYLKSG